MCKIEEKKPYKSRSDRKNVQKQRLIQLFEIVPVNVDALIDHDKSVGIKLPDDGCDLGDLVLAYDGYQHMCIRPRIAADGIPLRQAVMRLSHKFDLKAGEILHFGYDHDLHINVLHVHVITHQRADDRIDERVDHGGHIKQEQADANSVPHSCIWAYGNPP